MGPRVVRLDVAVSREVWCVESLMRDGAAEIRRGVFVKRRMNRELCVSTFENMSVCFRQARVELIVNDKQKLRSLDSLLN